ncbi:MAG: hypothetical protein ACM31E_10910 [Fibrobacterota bacterium]|nr:hypothetical protein [Chitinispirillaceae bacterium]
MFKKLLMLISVAAFGINADIIVNLSGKISNVSGQPLANAIVSLEKASLVTESGSSGQYSFSTTIDVKKNIPMIKTDNFTIKNGTLVIGNNYKGAYSIGAFNLSGKCIWKYQGESVTSGNTVVLPKATAPVIYKVSVSNYSYIIKANRANTGYAILSKNTNGSTTLKSAQSLAVQDTIRVSKAGYKAKRLPLESLTGTLNVTLDTLIADSIGRFYLDDGSYDRIAKYGEAQYFWGTLGGVDQPLVKITHAVSNDVVDIEVVFSPYFVDNTYGVNAIGWGTKGHTFKDLWHSDHVALGILNGIGDTVFSGKLDLIHGTTETKSGYACLGPFGGEGAIYKGNASDIVSFGNSLDDNLNYFGYNLQTDSPKTDETYKVNPDYPYWQYYVVYRMTIKRSAFGSSGFGMATMTSVHASPSKGSSTITVIEKDPPTPNTPNDVFRFILPPVIKPPVIDTIDVD